MIHLSSSLPPLYFNPRAPCGARLMLIFRLVILSAFQSTRPVWGATIFTSNFFLLMRFQSTRPVWGATALTVFYRCHKAISIHAPRVGRDWGLPQISLAGKQFQSTRPVWGATLRHCYGDPCRGYFNPRAPCGARPYLMVNAFMRNAFQSTRPVWGATVSSVYFIQAETTFQSTRPVWGATSIAPEVS